MFGIYISEDSEDFWVKSKFLSYSQALNYFHRKFDQRKYPHLIISFSVDDTVEGEYGRWHVMDSKTRIEDSYWIRRVK